MLVQVEVTEHHGQRLLSAFTGNPTNGGKISTREDCCWELENLKLSKLAWEHNNICIWDSPKVCLVQYPSLVSNQSQILKHKHWETERKQKFWKILQRWVKFWKTTHTVRFMDYTLSRRRFRKYMSTCYPASRSEYALPALQASVSWPQLHGNAATQFTSIKFHLIVMLACHLASIVIFNLILPWNTETSPMSSI